MKTRLPDICCRFFSWLIFVVVIAFVLSPIQCSSNGAEATTQGIDVQAYIPIVNQMILFVSLETLF